MTAVLMYKFPGDSFFHDLLYLKQKERTDYKIPTQTSTALGSSSFSLCLPFPHHQKSWNSSKFHSAGKEGQKHLRRERKDKPEQLFVGETAGRTRIGLFGVCPFKRLNYFKSDPRTLWRTSPAGDPKGCAKLLLRFMLGLPTHR